MGSKLNTASDLRSAQLPWILLTLFVALAGYGAAALTTAGISQFLASLASAALSIFLALTITEVLLRPLYVRDVLHVARLSAEIHNAGLEKLERLTRIDVTDYLNPDAEVDLIGQPDMVKQIWPDLLDWAAAGKSHVRVHLPESVDYAESQKFEDGWKAKGCNRKGSTLTITGVAPGEPVLALLTSRHCLVAVSDGSPEAGNPLVLVFKRSRPVAYVSSLAAHIEDIRGSLAVPLYESGERRTSGEPN